MRRALIPALAALLLTVAAPARARRPPIARGATTIPWAIEAPRGEIARRLIAAALDLEPLRAVIEARYGGQIEVRGFALGAARTLSAEDGRPTVARELALDLRVRVDHGGAQLALGGGEVVAARLLGTAAARELAGGCRPGEVAVGLALALPRSSAVVAHEFGGIALRLCVERQLLRQCLVHQAAGALVTSCHPDIARERFEQTVCNAEHLARKRGFMASGAVACHHRWGQARLRYELYALAGDAPTGLNQAFLRRALAAWAGAGTELIRERYRERFLRRHPIVQGQIAP